MQYSLSSSDEGSLILQGRCAAAAGAKFKIFSAILQGNGYIEFTSFILIQLLNNLSIMLYQNLSAEVLTSSLRSSFHRDSYRPMRILFLYSPIYITYSTGTMGLSGLTKGLIYLDKRKNLKNPFFMDISPS